MFVTHPSRKLAKSLLLGEIYADVRSKWSKATLRKIDDEEAKLLGFKESCSMDVGSSVGEMDADNVEVQGLDDVEVEVQGLKEDRGEGMDDFIEDNNIIFEDYDHDTKAFMREYNFGEDYGPMEEAELDSEPHEAYTETGGGACYLDEDQMLDDLGPVLDDIGPIPEYLYEHSEQFFELSGEEDDGEEEVGCLPSP
ncbi:hypothetical protein LIER_08689 [Lithospermum erythrorhizon]|uniref:Uncharacterized protein n=1 Tax=Lithospermum erythrorhizon TaxID=34254 RepID=A0AAV3PD32_LITER